LGAALARHYAQLGAQVGLLGRRADCLQQLAASLPGGPHPCYPVDVADHAATVAAGLDFIARFGLPDLVIANAGVSVGTLTDYEEDFAAFTKVIQVNLLGMVSTFQPFVAAMRQAGQGQLVGIASVAGIRGLPGAGAYSASKAAAISYLESLRVELHGTGVRVTTICPGYIDTPMTQVNTYPMPFLLPVDEGARQIARAIARRSRYAVIPWPFALIAKLLRLLPDPLYDRLFAHAGRKPRGLAL
jgi:NAD(P)-dependent dehydrogenase (short-subunit alcohol dehydrogenase family)